MDLLHDPNIGGMRRARLMQGISKFEHLLFSNSSSLCPLMWSLSAFMVEFLKFLWKDENTTQQSPTFNRTTQLLSEMTQNLCSHNYKAYVLHLARIEISLMSLDIDALNEHMTHGLSCKSLECQCVLEQRGRDKELFSMEQYIKKQNVKCCLRCVQSQSHISNVYINLMGE